MTASDAVELSLATTRYIVACCDGAIAIWMFRLLVLLYPVCQVPVPPAFVLTRIAESAPLPQAATT
jgi:hypothetical protein